MLTAAEHQRAYADLPAVYSLTLREISDRVHHGLQADLRVKVTTTISGYWQRGVRQRMRHIRLLYDSNGSCFAVGLVAQVTASDALVAVRKRRKAKDTKTAFQNHVEQWFQTYIVRGSK